MLEQVPGFQISQQNQGRGLGQASEKARAVVSQLQADQALADRALDSDRDRQAAADAEIKGWRARAGEAATRLPRPPAGPSPSPLA